MCLTQVNLVGCHCVWPDSALLEKHFAAWWRQLHLNALLKIVREAWFRCIGTNGTAGCREACRVPHWCASLAAFHKFYCARLAAATS